LVNQDTTTPDTIFHSIEVIKLATVSAGIVGKGTVTGRNNAVAYSALPGSVMEGQRLELTATPAPGWAFTGWSGALTGTNPHPFLFPTHDTRLTATFAPTSATASVDDFNSGTWSGGSGWSGDWTISGAPTSGALMAQLAAGESITRTLTTPLTGATLSFDCDLDRISTSESGTVQVYSGSSWTTVWTQNSAAPDDSSNPNLVNTGNINLSGVSGAITQIRFTLNATGNGAFYIDNVVLSGTSSVAPNTAPLFSSDPISKTAATVGTAYTGTLAGTSSDPNNNPVTYSKVSGPAWLTIASNGTLSSTPASTDAGLNTWKVKASSSGGTSTATLLINVVTAPGANPPKTLTYSSISTTYVVGTAITNNTPTSSGGSVIRYAIAPALPTGLTLNFTTGVISGTPLVVSPTTAYTITATNADGSTTAPLSITVVSAYTAWSTQYHLVQGPNGDDDGDGNSNNFEFVAGLDPTNANSVFKVTIAPVAGQPNQMAISFSPIVSGRTYTVESTPDLIAGTWTALSGSTSSDVGNVRTVIGTGYTGPKVFYRVVISYP
jgi:Divergent InlB B-repeat domain/Putative Ig domain